jgi:hypothetical protein
MKAKSLISAIGAGTAAVVVLGMLAALPANAGNAQIKVTHAATPYKDAVHPVALTAAKAQPKVSQAKSTEIQVAVMAKSPSQSTAKRSCYIHR